MSVSRSRRAARTRSAASRSIAPACGSGGGSCLAGHALGKKSQCLRHGGIGAASRRRLRAAFLWPGTAQPRDLGGEAGQFRAQHRFQAHRLQRGEPAQRPLAVRPARERGRDVRRRRAEGAVARLRPQQRRRRLVEAAVVVLAVGSAANCAGRKTVSVSVCADGAGGQRQGAAGEALQETRKARLDVGEPCRRRRMRARRTETVEVAQQRHRRLAALAVVGVQPGQHPGLEARGIEPRERRGASAATR
jgi:hypothetical protein